jgi:hypothetical protein
MSCAQDGYCHAAGATVACGATGTDADVPHDDGGAGVVWTLLANGTTQTTRTLRAAWTVGSEVFAVGDGETILHSADRGRSWSIESADPPAGDSGDLFSMAGRSLTDMVIVGDLGLDLLTPQTSGGARHWILTSHTYRGLPWYSVWASSSGYYGVASDVDFYALAPPFLPAVIEVWTGPDDSQQLPNGRWAVWGDASKFVYGVGPAGNAIVFSGIGTAWQSSKIASFDLLATWGSDRSNVYAVGVNGTVLRTSGSATDGGATWSTGGPMPAGVQTSDWQAIWGSAPNDVFVVGAGGAIVHYDGTSWTRERCGGTAADLYGVFGNGTGDVYAVGADGTICLRR